MSDIQLDPVSNDVVISGGDLVIQSLDGAIRQDLKQRLQLFLAEWFLDNTQGVPYYQIILVKNPNLDLVEGTIKNVILNCPGVLELTEFQFNYDNAGRSLSVVFQARTTDGTVDLTVSLGVGG